VESVVFNIAAKYDVLVGATGTYTDAIETCITNRFNSVRYNSLEHPATPVLFCDFSEVESVDGIGNGQREEPRTPR
jgi:hypothetical protein